MAFPSEVLTDIERAKDYYSGLNAEVIANLKRGCDDCSVKNYKCIKRLLRSLDYKVELDEYDDTAKELVKDMLIIIGDYTIKVPPTVNAGADQSVPINETAYFSATIVPGSAAITSIQWSIVSGSGTLINSTTANLIVEDFPLGGTVLKVKVTDANGLTASDQVTLTGTAATMKVYYLFSDTNTLPTEEEILASDFVNIVSGSDYVVPVNNGETKYVMIAELLTEPAKVRWDDTVDTDNNGVIGANKTILSGVAVDTFRVYVTNFKTEFPNPIKLS